MFKLEIFFFTPDELFKTFFFSKFTEKLNVKLKIEPQESGPHKNNAAPQRWKQQLIIFLPKKDKKNMLHCSPLHNAYKFKNEKR
jgi:hypothetical protein